VESAQKIDLPSLFLCALGFEATGVLRVAIFQLCSQCLSVVASEGCLLFGHTIVLGPPIAAIVPGSPIVDNLHLFYYLVD